MELMSEYHERILAKNVALATDRQYLEKAIDPSMKSDSVMVDNPDINITMPDLKQLLG
jgi:hypothetical protein